MIGFHRILIGTAIFFFFMFAVLQGMIWLTRNGGLAALLLCVGSAGAAAALGYYYVHLERFVGRRVLDGSRGRDGPG